MSDEAAKSHRSLRPSRRHAAGAVAGFLIVPPHVLGGQAGVAPSDKLNLAGVGVGGMGSNYLRHCESETIVALADVDHGYSARVFARYPNAKTYRDYRELLDREKSIDAVIIGTPDHTHARVAMAAMELGKHVYCAKPLTRTIFEARQLARTAREKRLATQMSVQSSASA
ncbi:MAG: Gfo/Idh/MocA family oxidoreductase, partial [Bryobacterales bacterium]|nr:Gfo/Idh/MocA family oxidoreductase [Bryobacterales bacterium]